MSEQTASGNTPDYVMAMHKRLNSAAEFMVAGYTADTFVFTGMFQ